MGAAKRLYTARNQGDPIPAELRRAFEPWCPPPRERSLFDMMGPARPVPDAPRPGGRRRRRSRKAGGVIGTAGVKTLPVPAAVHASVPPWDDPFG